MPGRLIDHAVEALQLLVAPQEQPPGRPCGPRISTGSTHAILPVSATTPVAPLIVRDGSRRGPVDSAMSGH